MSQSYQLEGKVLLVMDAQTFESGFTKRELIVEVRDGKYPQEVSVEWVQDSVALLDGIEVGDKVGISFNIEGRKWEPDDGRPTRWFNSLKGWKIDVEGKTQVDQETGEPVAKPTKEPELDDQIPF